VGKVTTDKFIRILHKGEVAAEVPADALANQAPEYHKPSREPEYYRTFKTMDTTPRPVMDYNQTILDLLGQPTIASKEWVYEQYDHQVRTNTVVLPGSDAAVLRIRGTNKALAMTTDCNGRYVYLDPHVGGQIAVAEAARNIVASGGTPLAITDCMNYGNPENPEIFWQMEKSVDGISDACRALNTPVISGNVSLYNERSGTAIYPTPTIGMVGLVEGLAHVTTQGFKNALNLVYLVGDTFAEFGGSELQKLQNGGNIFGSPPSIDMEKEKKAQDAVSKAIRAGMVCSVHDISEGGLAVALAESLLAGSPGLGADINLDMEAILLFSESQSRFVVSVPLEHGEAFCRMANAICIGNVNDTGRMTIHCKCAKVVDLSVGEMREVWKEAIPRLLK